MSRRGLSRRTGSRAARSAVVRILTAIAAVTTPAIVYHAYLMSEALAYPVFLVAVAVLLKARSRSRRGQWRIAVPLVCLLAVATSVQFLSCRSRTSPRSRSAVAATIAGISLPAALTAAFVARSSASRARSDSTARRRTSAMPRDGRSRTGPLDQRVALPVLARARGRAGRAPRLGFMLDRPSAKFERAIAVLAISCTTLFIGQAAMICRR